jgi:hypothetical protein
MTTITVDEDCLKSVDKLQSLLKLRFDSFSGENITRGATVNWAVNQQISVMVTPTVSDNMPQFGTATGTHAAATSTVNFASFAGQPMMIYTASRTISSSFQPKLRKDGEPDASGMGID